MLAGPRLDTACRAGRRDRRRRCSGRGRARHAAKRSPTCCEWADARTAARRDSRRRHEARLGPPASADRSRSRHAAAEPRARARARRSHRDDRGRRDAAPTSTRALGRHGQWLPLDSPFAEATIGGIARHQRQRSAASPLRHAARSGHRRPARDDRRRPRQGRRPRREERRRLRSRRS